MADWLSVEQVERLCGVGRAAVVEWVELGVVEAEGPAPEDWRIPAAAVPRVVEVSRLVRDLELSPFAAALVYDLVAERRRLECRVRALERLLG